MDQLILLANASKYAFNIDKKSQFNQTVRFLKHCASLKIIYAIQIVEWVELELTTAISLKLLHV